MFRFAGLLALLLILAPSAHAFRLFPDKAQVAELRGFAYPRVNLDGKVLAVGPGLRIYDEHNRIITHGMLQKPGPVAFMLGASQEVTQIWLLTEDEKARLMQAIEQREELRKQVQQQ
jgi:hypothetical protein